MEQSLQRVYARRLKRPLTDDEMDILAERLKTMGIERLDDVVLECADANELEAWLNDPNAQ